MKMHSLNRRRRLPVGAAVAFHFVSFRNVSSFSPLSICSATRHWLQKGGERERYRGGKYVLWAGCAQKVERNKCRRVSCSQECQDICLLASSQVSFPPSPFPFPFPPYVKYLRINRGRKEQELHGDSSEI